MERLSKVRAVIGGFIDKYVLVFALLICGLSLSIAFNLAKSATFSMSRCWQSILGWREYAWLKIPRELKASEWYNLRPIGQILNRPPLAAYLHYCLSYVFSYFDPQGLVRYQLAYQQDWIEPMIKDAMTQTAIIANAVFYYPAVVFVILKGLKPLSGLVKLVAIFMMLNTPTLSIVDYIKLDLTGPHMGLLFLAIYCVSTEFFVLGMLFLTLSSLLNQTVAWYFIPFSAYIAAAYWRSIKTNNVLFLDRANSFFSSAARFASL